MDQLAQQPAANAQQPAANAQQPAANAPQRRKPGRPRQYADSQARLQEYRRQYYREHAEALKAARKARYEAYKAEVAI